MRLQRIAAVAVPIKAVSCIWHDDCDRDQIFLSDLGVFSLAQMMHYVSMTQLNVLPSPFSRHPPQASLGVA